jgi:hypothetical protein
MERYAAEDADKLRVATERVDLARAKQAAGKKLTADDLAVLAEAGAAKKRDEEARRANRRESWARAALLECQMQGQMAAASAHNPRSFLDLVATATGDQVTNTCIRMKEAQMDAMEF